MTPRPTHPNMSPEWFDDAVNRAHAVGLRMLPTKRNGLRFVTSGSSSKVYQVSRTTCSCDGHRNAGRCYHRAMSIFLTDVMRQSPPASQHEETA